MGWMEETGRHEGYVKLVFADGRLGGGAWPPAGGVTIDGPDGVSARHTAGEYVTRPQAAVIGWRVACNHVPAHVRDEDLGKYTDNPELWVSPTLWRRVYSPDEQDLDQHLIYAALDDPYSVDIDGRDDLEELLITEWRAHLEPEDHARSIRETVEAINQAQRTLDLEIAAARATGMSWAEIGRAAGVTRQAARERWGN